MYIIAEGLLIARKGFEILILYELSLQEIIDRGYAEIVTAVRFQYSVDRLLERGDVECLVLGKLCSRMLRDDIHVIILIDVRPAWWLKTLLLVVGDNVGLGIAAQF